MNQFRHWNLTVLLIPGSVRRIPASYLRYNTLST
jgi:hypothetical protein